jgi:3-dehydroquinate dehydratase-2
MSKNRILILNGPNLNLLGKRETTIYGEKSFDDYFQGLKLKYPNIDLDYVQSNDESELINQIHQSLNKYNGIIINPGAYGHTSIALADAISSVEIRCIEVHISNIYARENFRHYTLISSKCIGTISGFGLASYALALNYFN